MDTYRMNLDMYKDEYSFPKQPADKIAEAKNIMLESVNPPIRWSYY